ncbi:MAG: acyltransferase [Neomegalonema sp.]|nr:acyltransferase [Neomegalonema sp.]
MTNATDSASTAAPASADTAPSAAQQGAADRSGGFKQWVKRRETPLARGIYAVLKGAMGFSMPVIPYFHRALYAGSRHFWDIWSNLLRVFWYTPLFRSRLETPPRRVYLSEGLPVILGPLRIRLGEECRVSGVMTLSGRSASTVTPVLEVGDNCDLGWGCTIAVSGKVSLGDNVRLAPSVTLSGYPGHPLDAVARARHEPCTESQIGDIVLEDDVWLGQRVMVTPGVTIGRGTVVGMGSVVTKDLPAGVLAAGVPARVIRPLAPGEGPEAVEAAPSA